MCGRFTLTADPQTLAHLFGLATEPYVVARYNIAPTQPVAIVRLAGDSRLREWSLVQWGLVPSWSKDPSIGSRMINARAETVAEKPSYRAALRRRRCLLPASGFYEWQKRPEGKRPFYIQLADGSPFAFAGLWESWRSPDGSELDSCTLLTTEANELMEPIHNRMPVILEPEAYTDWLGTGEESSPEDVSQLQHLLRPYSAEGMKAYRIGSYVNDPRHEGVDCIRPVTD